MIGLAKNTSCNSMGMPWLTSRTNTAIVVATTAAAAVTRTTSRYTSGSASRCTSGT